MHTATVKIYATFFFFQRIHIGKCKFDKNLGEIRRHQIDNCVFKLLKFLFHLELSTNVNV